MFPTAAANPPQALSPLRAGDTGIAFAARDHVAVQRLVAQGLAARPPVLGLHAGPGVAVPGVPAVGSRGVSAVVAAGPRLCWRGSSPSAAVACAARAPTGGGGGR